VIPFHRNPVLPASIGILILSIFAAPGCCKRWCGTGETPARAEHSAEAGRGVEVTAPVPHAGTTGASTDNAAATPAPGPVPREIPIGKKPPANVVPSAEEPR